MDSHTNVIYTAIKNDSALSRCMTVIIHTISWYWTPVLNNTFLSEIQEVFSLFDQDGDGCISGKEVGAVLRSIGFNPSEAEILKLLDDFETDRQFINTIIKYYPRGTDLNIRLILYPHPTPYWEEFVHFYSFPILQAF